MGEAKEIMGNYIYNIDAKILNKVSNNRTQCAINNNNKDKKSNKTSWSSRVHARKVKSKEGRHMTNSISSVAQLCLTLCDPMDCSMPGFPVHHQLLEPGQTHVRWVSDTIQPSQPLSSPSPPTFNLSQHQVFSNESALHIKWPKYWSFSFSISPSNEYSWLISFGIDWFDLLAVQGTLKRLL